MSSVFGKNIKISIFGQSHSEAIGVVIDGLTPGFEIDFEKLTCFMRRRAPGQGEYSTKRTETDTPRFISGLVDGVTCGAPLCAVIENNDTRSGDYDNLRDTPRPAHADFTAHIKYGGFQDVRGGGHFSGRLTAPLCLAGGICLQMLEREGIEIGAHIASVGDVSDTPVDMTNVKAEIFSDIKKGAFPVLSKEAGEKMLYAIKQAKQSGDSLGGVIECAAAGIPPGLGEPMFDGMENRISAIVFAIPAVRGIEFGAGFKAARMKGSEHNDEFFMDEGLFVKTRTNNHGGILGGITSGMPLVFRAAFKPTPSIALEQESVSLSKCESARLIISGRHDPCIVPRAVPCVEAAAAIAVFDAISLNRNGVF